MLEELVERLHAASAVGLAEKLGEYRGKQTENVLAELRMGEALSIATRSRLYLQCGDAHDLRLMNETIDCTVEVEHKSSVSAFAAIFYPELDVLEQCREASDASKRTVWQLDQAVRASRFEIEPWIRASLDEPA